MTTSRKILAFALFALSVLYSVWFHDDKHRLAAMIVFTLPPLLLLVGVLLGNAKASFWAGVFGLFWFSHGVMLAYSNPGVRVYAWIEIVLSLTIILASSWSGLSAKFGKKRG
jgi:uncharacterized membrane protein